MELLNRTNPAALLKRDAAPGSTDLVWFRLCSPKVDTYNTIIEPQGVRGVVGKSFVWAHETGVPGVAVGRIAAAEQDTARLDIGVEFDRGDPFAVECERKVRGGYITGCSIGCAPLKWEKRTVGGQSVIVYTEVNLLEASLVIAASNPDARKLDRAARRAQLRRSVRRSMDKNEFLKLVGLDEAADREAVESAVLSYLCETSDDSDRRKAVVAAMDELFPEVEREGEGEEKEEAEALREALAETRAALEQARAAVPAAQDAAKQAAEREAKVVAQVDAWIAEGRVRRSERAKYLEKHRAGKAERIVRHIEAGTFTTAQSLHGGDVGTVTDLPTPRTEVKRSAGEDALERVANKLSETRVSPLHR